MDNLFICDGNNQDDIYKTFKHFFSPRFKELEESTSIIHIGHHSYEQEVMLEEMDIIIRILKKEWFHMQNIIINEICTDDIPSRTLINKSLYHLADSLQLCDCPPQKNRYVIDIKNQLDIFLKCTLPMEKFGDTLFKITNLNLNSNKTPIHQYYHTYLEVQFYLVILDHISLRTEDAITNHIEKIIKDIVLVSQINYKRHGKNANVFICNCTKTFWIFLQLFLEEINPNENLFWNIFNKVLQDEDPLFSLWLLNDISKLQCFENFTDYEGIRSRRIKPNYQLLETKVKKLVTNADSNTFMECFKNIKPLICELWLKDARIEVYQIIWDAYSKRLNASNKIQQNYTALEFYNLVNDVLENPENSDEDFNFFVGMLLLHLREYSGHWSKMKGRIYSQLGPNKIRDLSEIGISHVVLLFMALSSINFDELCKKLVAFLDSLPTEKKNLSIVWNIQAAFIIRQLKEGRDIEKTAVSMVKNLQEISNDYKLFKLIKEFILNFGEIIKASENLQLHQWSLIDSWLPKYLSRCYHSDLEAALKVLATTLDSVSTPDAWSHWQPAYKDFVYPFLKQAVASRTSVPPSIVGSIAGRLCLLMPNISNEIFSYFCGETTPHKVSSLFLLVVLENPDSYLMNAQQESLVVQAWAKSCLLSLDPQEELSRKVLRLDAFPAGLRAHAGSSNDPMYALIQYLGSDLKSHAKSSGILKLCDVCFGQTDKWLPLFLNQPESEEVVTRLFTCVGLAFLHCGDLLYNPNKSSTPLISLIQNLLLPSNFLIGKNRHVFVMTAVKKTWHLFYEAIVKIKTASDIFLDRTLKDLIVRYMPFFSTLDSPIVKCLDNETTCAVVLEKISSCYFSQSTKETDANVLKALKLVSDFTQSTTSLTLIKFVVNKALYSLFEVVIFHSQRNSAIGVIKVITNSVFYPQIREDFANSVVLCTEKHMAFYSGNYFQLMNVLAKFIPHDVKKLLVNIKQQVSVVERMRGVGFDKNLRSLYEKLESAVQTHLDNEFIS